MIKVYFENGRHAEIVAVFSDEAVYMACLPALKKLGKSLGMKVTESVEEDVEFDLDEHLEIHHDIVEAIVHAEFNAENYGGQNLVTITSESQGKGGLYELGISLTAKFVEEYKDTVWGEELEYLDTMEEFLKKELYGNS